MKTTRRNILASLSLLAAGSALPLSAFTFGSSKKLKIALVGTGIRDGVMSTLIGIAARKSIESGNPVNIAELTDLEPRVKRI
jgi:hypothetical protein